MSNKDKKTAAAAKNGGIPLDDARLDQTNGGMKIIVLEKPKFLQSILKLIFKIKGDN